MPKPKGKQDKKADDERGSRFGPVISDPRFSRIHSDARFAIQSKKQTKLKVDDRFQALVNDKRFRIQSKRDPRGFKRPELEDKKQQDDLSRLYSVQGDDEEEEEEEEEETEQKRMQAANGYGENEDEESSDDSSNMSSDIDEDDDEQDAQSEIVQEWGAGLVDENIPQGNATRRIALVHMDWDNIKAVDLLAVLRSFTPPGGMVKKVSIIPTEFGVERMKMEDEKGPQTLWEDLGEEEEEEADDDDDDNNDINSEKYNEKLRKYEMERFKYFYALAECDTVRTAQALYDECDGVEFSRTANMIDLRFIPDDYQITREPRETATSVPLEYSAPTFQSNALQHSKVKLSWDTDDVHRSKVLKRKKLTEDEIKEEDFKAFLASDSEDEPFDDDDNDDNEEKGEKLGSRKEKDAVAKYKALLGLNSSGPTSNGDSKKNQKVWTRASVDESDASSDEDDGDNNPEFGDKTVTFSGNVEALVQNVMNNKANQEKSVWDQYLEKRKEKKKQKKAAKLAEGGLESAGQGFDDDFFLEENDVNWEDAENLQEDDNSDPSNSTTRERKKRRKGDRNQTSDNKSNSKEEADLGLLLLDDRAIHQATKGLRLDPANNDDLSDEDDARGPKQRRKLSKKARIALKNKNKDKGDEFQVDFSDTRFQALFTDPNYAIDPTDPQSKKSPGLALIASEKRKRATAAPPPPPSSLVDGHDQPRPSQNGPPPETKAAVPSDKEMLNAMVKALKRKVEARNHANGTRGELKTKNRMEKKKKKSKGKVRA